jgi:hypothetical protein
MTSYEYLNSTKNTITNYVVFILTPHIYDGLNIIYNCSNTFLTEYDIKREKEKNLKPLDILEIFIKCLEGLFKLTHEQKEKEYLKIKKSFENTNGNYFDSLILSCLKSNYACLTFNNENNDFIELQTDSINISHFIFNCYIESAQYFTKNPDVFIKKNKKTEIFDIVKQCIQNTIIKSISSKELYDNYLKQLKNVKIPDFENLTIEHIKPLSGGKTNNNVQPYLSPIKEPKQNIQQYFSPIKEEKTDTPQEDFNVEEKKEVICQLKTEDYIHEDDLGGKPSKSSKKTSFQPNTEIKKNITYFASDAEDYFNDL